MLRWMIYLWIVSRQTTAKNLPIDLYWIRNYCFHRFSPKSLKFLQGAISSGSRGPRGHGPPCTLVKDYIFGPSGTQYLFFSKFFGPCFAQLIFSSHLLFFTIFIQNLSSLASLGINIFHSFFIQNFFTPVDIWSLAIFSPASYNRDTFALYS